MNIRKIAAQVDPVAAQMAIARAMVALGSESNWDSETIEHVCSAISPAFPSGLPSVFNQDDGAVDFWASLSE